MGAHHERALCNLDELLTGGIDVHIQIVLVPDINDGEVLESTLAYLKKPFRRERILSVGIVPVAHTDYSVRDTAEGELAQDGSTRESAREPAQDYCDEARAKAVIEQVQRHQFVEQKATGISWVYLADEFYIYANAPFPLPEYYGDFPQLENGIGMVLNFVADMREHFAELKSALDALPASGTAGEEALTIVCGELLRETWLGTLSALGAGGRVRLLPVRNRFFGGNVSVTGLLTAGDILRAIEYDLSARKPPDSAHAGGAEPATSDRMDALPLTTYLYIVPDCVFNDDGITLDDLTVEQMHSRTAASLCIYEANAKGLTDAIRDIAEELNQQ
jgi:NifB/MoaA-like Fe-S oxidoreductase